MLNDAKASTAWAARMTRRSAIRSWFAALLGILLGRSIKSSAQEMQLEYELKAAFLFNFLKFTQWPKTKFAPATPSMVVGCLADDPATPFLVHALADKTMNGLPIRVTPFTDLSEVTNCHVMFISRARKAQIDDLLTRLRQAPVLTVSEVEQFSQRGGMINFVRQERTLRFEINLEAAERVRLKFSSDLSSMAIVVKTQTPK